jgi:hypothetical protein
VTLAVTGARRLHAQPDRDRRRTQPGSEQRDPSGLSDFAPGAEHSHRRGTQNRHGPQHRTDHVGDAIHGTPMRGVTNNTASSGIGPSRPRTSAVTYAAACTESRCSDNAEA